MGVMGTGKFGFHGLRVPGTVVQGIVDVAPGIVIFTAFIPPEHDKGQLIHPMIDNLPVSALE
jgi:hypothetical protein